LADLAWQVFWNRAALADADGDMATLLRRTQGFVIFIHGWSGSHKVWELLPALTCAANSRLVALAPDLNGFGRSPFLAEVPAIEQCDPHAIIHSVNYWVDMLGLRSGKRARRRRKVITFVGHSIGAAALFYLSEQGWHRNELARCAVAPTLLIYDNLRQQFYQELGVASWSSRPIEELKARLTPRILDRLLGSVNETTRSEHLRIFESTPKGTLAQTFYAMGMSQQPLMIQNWHDFKVILGDNDRLLNVSDMLRLLDDMGLAPHQVRVTRGDHYLFSATDVNHRLQRRNREIVLGEILYLHEVCRENQRL
jgi:pimeloyl-ACP methyl ester carboxylesterase